MRMIPAEEKKTIYNQKTIKQIRNETDRLEALFALRGGGSAIFRFCVVLLFAFVGRQGAASGRCDALAGLFARGT